jgi:hypothetical protein
MGVTSIKKIINQTEFHVAFRKLQDSSDAGFISPGSYIDNEVWIPWCDDSSQFSSNVLILEINEDIKFYIWQKGDTVFYCKTTPFSTGQPYNGILKYPIKPIPNSPADPNIFSYGQPIPGIAHVDGNRALKIYSYPNQNLVLKNYFDIYLQAF